MLRFTTRILSVGLLHAGCTVAPSPEDGQSDTFVQDTLAPSCQGQAALISMTSQGGVYEHSLEPMLMPYGHESWFINGRCEALRYEARTRVSPGGIQGASLNPAQVQRAKSLATNPVLAEYNNSFFQAPHATCEGSQMRVTNLRGTFTCQCSCHPDFVELPAKLRAYVDELSAFRLESDAQLQALPPGDLGVLAIDESSALWSSSFQQIPDEHWQPLELPIDTATLAALDPSQPIRISDPKITAQLREQLATHQAWQPSRIHPSLIYLKHGQGQRFVLAVVELAEPGLVPGH